MTFSVIFRNFFGIAFFNVTYAILLMFWKNPHFFMHYYRTHHEGYALYNIEVGNTFRTLSNIYD